MNMIYQTLLDSKLRNLNDELGSEFIRLKMGDDEQQKNAYSFLIFSMMSICDIGIDDAISCSTEGSGDLNIDGFYIDASKNAIHVHLFQSKYKINPIKQGIKENDIKAMIFSVTDILNGEIPQFRINPRMKAKIEELRDSIEEFGKLPIINIHFVTNGGLPDEKEKEVAQKFSDKNNRNVYYYSASEIFSCIGELEKQDYTVNIQTQGNVSVQMLGNVKGIVTTLSAQELLRIYEEGGEENILEKNIRYYLGSNKINSKIAETASSESEAPYFWFLNNGISIVCDYSEYEGDTHGNNIIRLDNPTIVNGGQTTKTLFELSKQNSFFPESFKKVSVLVRIYETKNQNLIEKITEGTNRQNPIFIRDLKSNNPLQNIVKEYFKEKGFYLETKRNEFVSQKISYRKIFKNDTVMQAYLSFYKELPHQAKSSKASVFEKYFDIVFTLENISLSSDFFRSAEMYHFLKTSENTSENIEEYPFLPHATFAILYIIAIIYKDSTKSEIPLDIDILTQKYIDALNILKHIVEAEKERSDDYSGNKLFKSSTLLGLINATIKKSFVEQTKCNEK